MLDVNICRSGERYTGRGCPSPILTFFSSDDAFMQNGKSCAAGDKYLIPAQVVGFS